MEIIHRTAPSPVETVHEIRPGRAYMWVGDYQRIHSILPIGGPVPVFLGTKVIHDHAIFLVDLYTGEAREWNHKKERLVDVTGEYSVAHCTQVAGE